MQFQILDQLDTTQFIGKTVVRIEKESDYSISFLFDDGTELSLRTGGTDNDAWIETTVEKDVK